MTSSFFYYDVIAVRESASVLIVIEVDDVNDNAPVLNIPQYAWPELANVIMATVDVDAPALTTLYMLEVTIHTTDSLHGLFIISSFFLGNRPRLSRLQSRDV